MVAGWWALAVCLAGVQDEKPKRDLTELSIEELLALDVGRVVGASGYMQRVGEAPASVTVVTAEEIRRFGYRTMADLLRSVRGAAVTYDRNYSYLGLRGFGLPSDYNNRVLFLADGHRLNDNIFNGTLFGNEFVLDLDLVERVEIVRGPSSSLYGSNAFLGVVNLLTRSGKEFDGVETSASVGSYDTYQGRVSVGKRFENGVDVLLSASAGQSRGQDLYYREFDDPATGNGLAPDADGEEFWNAFLKISWKGLTLSGGYVTREKQIPTASFATIFPSQHSRTWDERGYVDLNGTFNPAQGTTITARAFVDGYWYRGDYEYEDTSSGTPVRYLNKDETVGGEAGTEVKGMQELFAKKLLLTVGAEYRKSFKQHQENYDDVDPKVVYLDSDETDHAEGAYAQVDADLGSGFRLNAGVRYDHYHTFGSTANPRAGLLWSPNGSTAVKVMGGTAYRAPSAYELYYVTQGGTIKAGPEHLDPETIATYEASVEHEFRKGVRGVITGFVYDVDDVITLETDPADGLLYLSNSGEVKGTGVEAELQLRFDNGTLGRFSYSYQEAKETDGDHRLPNSPRNLAQASFSYPLVAEKLFAGLEFQYVGERRNLTGEIVDDYAVLNLTFYSRELFEGMEFSATVRNLLGSKYADPGATEHAQGEIEQDGMNFQLKLTWKF